jgi:prenyltransferase beta subunit
MGSGATKSGKAADHYHQNSGIIPGIAMAKYDYFMDPTTHTPLEMDLVLQPFGKVGT